MARIYSGFTVMGTRARKSGNRTEIFTSPPSRASSVYRLVGPGLLLLNTRGAVVLGKEVCELLKKTRNKFQPITRDGENQNRVMPGRETW